MKKILLNLIALFFLTQTLYAQNFPFGATSLTDLQLKKYSKDTAAHAVVMQEYGRSAIDVVADDKIMLIYEYHVKIKIFDAKAFDEGTVEIPVYNNSNTDDYETVDDIAGVTYYLDDNGLMRKAELENTKIYPVKESKHWGTYKFAMPALRNGCVIEYKYRIQSPYFQNFHSWKFQSDIPKIYSEYEVHIPGFWNYNASIRGNLKLTKNTSTLERECFSFHGAKSDCSFIVYGMKDIPAFEEEDYMTSKKNFMSAINFELMDYSSFDNGAKIRVAQDWKDLDYQLRTQEYFGGQLKRKSLLKDKITPVIAGKANDLDKAKAIYAYIQKSFKWNEFRGIYSESIGKAIDNHSGSVPDINLTLVTALEAAGLDAEAVLLSTRDNGMVNTLYPGLGDFDYVIAKVNIAGQSYLMDASDPMLSFGMLPFTCLNDKGRVFSLSKPSYWMDLTALPQKEKNTYSLDVTLQDDGKLKGTLVHYSIGYEAYKKRLAIKKFNSTDEYIENLSSRMPKLKILKAEIANVDSLDLPVTETYQIEMNLYNKMSADRLTFNPYLLDKISTNPFKLTDRSFPVDWGMPSDERFTLTMHLPAKYTIEAPPADIALALPNSGGRFLTSYSPGDNSFTFTHVIQFNKSIYSSEEYPYLKELYNKIIQSEKGEMIFKKL